MEPSSSACGAIQLKRVLVPRSLVAKLAQEGLSAQEPSSLACRA